MFFRFRHGFLICFLLTAGLWGAPSVCAQPLGIGPTGSLRISLLAGFSSANPVYRPGHWIPVTLEVENLGESDITGVIVVGPKSDSTVQDVQMQIPVRIVSRQRKIYRAVTVVPEFTDDLEVALVTGYRSTPFGAVGLRAMGDSERLTVVLSSDTSSYGWLDRFKEEEGTKVQTLSNHTFTRSDLLPDLVQGYDLVAALIWDGGDLDPLADEQVVALRRYVEMGGTLVLCLGDRGDQLNLPPWNEFLGARPTGSRPRVIAEKYAGGLRNGVELRSAISQWVTEASAPISASRTAILEAQGDFPGEPCLTVDGEPLVYRRSFGGGTIYVSKLALSDWPKMGGNLARTWADFFVRLPPSVPPIAAGMAALRGDIESSLLGRLPGPLFVGCFLGLYTLLAVPLNYFFFRKSKRRELAWLMLPPLALAFSVGAYYLGAIQQRGGVTQRGLLVGVMPYGSSEARCLTQMGIYSPTRRTFELGSDEPLLVSPHTRQSVYESTPSRTPPIPFVPDPETGAARPEIPPMLVHHWAAREQSFDHVADLGGSILVAATRTETGFQVRVQNQSRFNLTAVQLVNPPRKVDLPAMIPGEIRNLEVKIEDPLPSNSNNDYRGYGRDQPREFPAYLSEVVLPHVLSLPISSDEPAGRFMNTLSPPGSEELGIYALAQIQEPICPVNVDANLFESTWNSYLLLPVLVNQGEESTIKIGPRDWDIRIQELAPSGAHLTQGDRGARFGSYYGTDNKAIQSSLPMMIHTSERRVVTGTLTFRPFVEIENRFIHSLSIGWSTSEVEMDTDPYSARILSASWSIWHSDVSEWVMMDAPYETGPGDVWGQFTPEEGTLKLKFEVPLPKADREEFSQLGFRLIVPQARLELLDIDAALSGS